MSGREHLALGLDEPLTLQEACAIAFPNGEFAPEDLRRAALDGRLTHEKVGTHIFVTRRCVEEMERPKYTDRDIRNAGECIYVVGFGPYVKIGRSGGALHQRLNTLRTGAPEPLVVYAIIPQHGPNWECEVHKWFARYRLQGEWFRHEGAVTRWIEEGCPL